MTDDKELADLTQMLIALSDRTRLRLLSVMATGEVAVGYLADSLGESQPKISRHLAYLRSVGLVSTRRDGKSILYSIKRPEKANLDAVLEATISSVARDGQIPPRSENRPREDYLEKPGVPNGPEQTGRSTELEIFLL